MILFTLFLLFAGLGEMMPEQLWETTMNPETRILKQLVVDDIAEANMTFSSLMGARVSPKLGLILLCKKKKTDDIFTNFDLFFDVRSMPGKNS